MKNIIKNSISALVLVSLFSLMACDEDRFSPIVEIDIPPHTPRLAIRADWQIGSDSLAVFVSRSRGVLDKSPLNFNPFNTQGCPSCPGSYDTIPDAKVELFRNDQLLGTIPYTGKGYHIAKKLFKIDTVSGVTYKIRVSAAGFETVEAEQKTQNSLTILRGAVKSNGAVYRDPFDPFATPEKGDELSIELQDNASDNNYYNFVLTPFFGFFNNNASMYVERDTLGRTYRSSLNLQAIDPNMDGGFLPDKTFNGKTYTWRIWSSPNLYFYDPTGRSFSNGRLQKGDRLTIPVSSFNKDLPLYEKSLDLAYQAQDNPFFTEPVILYSNVKNGHGIFTINSVRTVKFTIQ